MLVKIGSPPIRRRSEMLIANYDYAATNRFVTHEIDEYKPKLFTRCGIALEGTRGNWEISGDDLLLPSCKNCLRSLGHYPKDE